ncbi:hypothetical protein B0J11DRAFT_580655 [Dendryphion nanum]|uniref:Uncharacterized protein n=1 Tax=Dendryphion nanum TaxID=256645 RepID=A0A9P9DRW2_9PLEO|nr:hypothetical protein B0J11DRAFT_580655 [Dendryphion nanum]
MAEKFFTKAAQQPYIPALRDFLKQEDIEAEKNLIDHLENNKFAYARYLWINENVNERTARLDGVELPGGDQWSMGGMSSSEPSSEDLGKLREVVSLPKEDTDAPIPGDTYVEQLISLPTRGVFAEAKLGHCNANEIIDDTRFWDWQKSPIPYQAPKKTGADAEHNTKHFRGSHPLSSHNRL